MFQAEKNDGSKVPEVKSVVGFRFRKKVGIAARIRTEVKGCARGWQTSVKDQIVTGLGFIGHIVFMAATQPCHFIQCRHKT